MITLSTRADIEVVKIISEQGLGKVYLRVSVKGGGCSGFQYTLGFDDTKAEIDQVCVKEWQPEDVEVICDPKSFLYLSNTVIDFKDGLMGRGFEFINPNASNSCGCGESFSV